MTPDLTEDLKRVIDLYLEGHRSRSLATLTRVSGVAYSTLRRFAQKEGAPTAEPVLKILDATLPTTDKIAFLQKHFPEIARTISRYAERSLSQDEEPSKEHLKMFFRQNPHNLILNLAITVAGTTVDIIRRLCGERGLAALDEMVECQVLMRDHATGKVRYRDDTLVCLDSDFLLNQIRHSTDYFDRSMLGTKAARLAHMTAAVNREGLERIHTILSEALNEVATIHEDPRYWGKIPYFAGALMNVYDKKPLLDDEDQP